MTSSIINLSHLFTKFSLAPKLNPTIGNVNRISPTQDSKIPPHVELRDREFIVESVALQSQCNATAVSDTPLKTYGGGSNTNKAGLLFEQNACLYSLCKEIGFIDNATYSSKSKLSTKQHNNKVLTCCSKNSFKKLINTKYQLDMYREPDDALIIDEPGRTTTIYIIEKKEQHQSGSIDEKLFAVKYYLEDYKLNFGPEFNIKYVLCVSSYLWDCIENPINKNGKYNKWKNYKLLICSEDIFIINGDNDYETQIKKMIPELNI